jgi:hypothetical protein
MDTNLFQSALLPPRCWCISSMVASTGSNTRSTTSLPRDLALVGFDGLKDPRVGGNGMGINNSGTFILPDPSKKFYWESFWEPLWNSAAERLRTADAVFIHGYSMPAADARARKLLFENIDKSAKISIHCRSTSDRIAEEFRSRGFTSVTSFPTIGFEDWAAS